MECSWRPYNLACVAETEQLDAFGVNLIIFGFGFLSIVNCELVEAKKGLERRQIFVALAAASVTGLISIEHAVWPLVIDPIRLYARQYAWLDCGAQIELSEN